MAGILANSVTNTMTTGTTDAAVTGYLSGEAVTLSTNPAGTDYVWALSRPSGSTTRSELTGTTGASVKFSPDVEGYYVVTCTVDSSTVYVLRISVLAIGSVADRSVIRLAPILDAQVPTPATGVSLFCRSSTGLLAFKDSTGTVTNL